MGRIVSFPKMKIKSTIQTATISSAAVGLLIIVLTTTSSGVLNAWAADLIGTSGPDTLDGTNEDDNIYGLGGNDRISDGLGSDKVYAGSGDDILELDGVGGYPYDTNSQDIAFGEAGRDNIAARDVQGFMVIYGGGDGDIIFADSSRGQIYAQGGNDEIRTGDADYDVWAGPGNDYIDGASECGIRNAYGEAGNDRIISPNDFASGGPGNDYIEFRDCLGVAFGDSGNDELRASAEYSGYELHGGSGDDKVIGESNNDILFGDRDDDTLTGRDGADSFSCGTGIDTITDYNAAEGDTKTADCESF